MKKNTHAPLLEALIKYSRKNPTRFHMPGHKGRGLGKKTARLFKDNLFSWDITEISGLDDLHQPTGAIKEAQERLAHLYKADKSYFLVNGATSGIIAMMGAVLNPGEKIALSRASHRAVTSGLILTGANPVYIMPELDKTLGVYTQVTPKAVYKTLKAHPDTKAVLITSPVYQGFCTDLGEISKLCKKNNCLLLVDEAHGPHLGFNSKLPRGAKDYPVDAWVQSPHKMLFSFTQSAWLHVKGNHIDTQRLRQWLSMMTSSSPSYIFMASLDLSRAVMEKYARHLAEKALRLSHISREKINKNTPFYCVGSEVKGYKGIYDIDLSRLMVNVSKAGYTGYEVDRILRDKFNIYAEYADFSNVYFLMSFSNTKFDIKRLIYALSCFEKKGKAKKFISLPQDLPVRALKPKEAFYSSGEFIALKKARGHIVKEPLVPYPPGIPLVMPGEILEKHHIDLILEILSAGGSCQGVCDRYKIQVVK